MEQRERVASTHQPEETSGPGADAGSTSGGDAEAESFDMGQLMRESNEWTAANDAPTDDDDGRPGIDDSGRP